MLAATAILLGGCLMRVAYNNADMLIRWELDRYFDLSPAQHRILDTRLPPFVVWHRAQELPSTIALLRKTDATIESGVTDAALEQLTQDVTALQRALVERLLDDAVALFAKSDAEQLDHLRNKFANANEKWDKRLKLPADERLEDRRERILERVEDWVGDLSDEQYDALAAASDRIPDVMEAWLAYRKKRQAEFIELVALAHSDAEAARAGLLRYFTTPPPETFAAHRVALHSFIIAVDRACTDKQRAHARKRLRTWIEDLETFIAQPT